MCFVVSTSGVDLGKVKRVLLHMMGLVKVEPPGFRLYVTGRMVNNIRSQMPESVEVSSYFSRYMSQRAFASLDLL